MRIKLIATYLRSASTESEDESEPSMLEFEENSDEESSMDRPPEVRVTVPMSVGPSVCLSLSVCK
jgi:hypothetical protein